MREVSQLEELKKQIVELDDEISGLETEKKTAFSRDKMRLNEEINEKTAQRKRLASKLAEMLEKGA